MGADGQEPVSTTDREELIYLLSEASKLEHGLCCSYLFAAFSLRSILTAMPATAAGDSPRAGPSFAFYRSIDYLPHREAAWIVFAERLDEIASFCMRLSATDKHGLGLDRVSATIATLAAGLQKRDRDGAAQA